VCPKAVDQADGHGSWVVVLSAGLKSRANPPAFSHGPGIAPGSNEQVGARIVVEHAHGRQ
jgi:hypothetical protein